MAGIDEQELAVARVYALALIGLAGERGETRRVEEELAIVVGLLDRERGLERLLSSPLVDDEVLAGILEKAFRGRVSDLVTDTLQVMRGKRRLGLLRALAEAYRQEHETQRGEVDVEVTTAVELSDELRRRIADTASRYTGRQARLVERVDPDLLGGLVLQVGDRKIDGSLARQIHELKGGLHARASLEVHSGKEYFES